LTPLFALLISFSATLTCGQRLPASKAVVMASRLLAIVIGVGLVAIGVLLFVNFAQVKMLTTALQPGLFGGVLLLFLNILYLPNAAIALASYVAGSGFAAGAGTLISPWWHHMDQLPVFPLLGTIPLHRHPLLIVTALLFVGVGVLLAIWTLSSGIDFLMQTLLFFIVGLVLFAYLSSGSLMTDEMGAFGVSVWKFGLAAGVEVIVGMLFTTFLVARSSK
jgi:hypothetical protein